MSDMAVKRAVVTGATGMIGVALVNELAANGCEVVALVRPGSEHAARLGHGAGNAVKVVECGLEKLDRFDANVGRCDVFYHLGWSGTSPEQRRSPAAQERNIGYTLEAVRLAERLGCRRFVGSGSQAEYGSGGLLSPDSPTAPSSAYGVAKYAAGALARLECASRGMDCLWVRIFSVYGRYDLPGTMISTALDALENGRKPSFTPAVQLWDYLECGDAARALRLVGQSARACGQKVYCLGSGEARPLREYIEQLRDIVSPGAPLGIGELGYAGGGAPLSLCADISALTADTGFLPEVSFAEGIRRLAAWRRQK